MKHPVAEATVALTTEPARSDYRKLDVKPLGASEILLQAVEQELFDASTSAGRRTMIEYRCAVQLGETHAEPQVVNVWVGSEPCEIDKQQGTSENAQL